LKKSSTIGVSKLAFYAEDPSSYAAARGSVYNKAAARLGERKHESIGRRPSKAIFTAVAILLIAAVVYFKG
jgi:hypothetical protein